MTGLYRATLSELVRLPGVEAAAATNNLPVERALNLQLRRMPVNVLEPGAVDWRYAAGDYLRVPGIPLVAGRAFEEGDHRAGSAPVAVVNEAFARRFGGGRPVTGTRLQMTALDMNDAVREIVGIVGDVRTRGGIATRPTGVGSRGAGAGLPPRRGARVLPGSLGAPNARRRDGRHPSIERIIRDAEPLLPITAFRTMDEVVAGSLAPTRFSAVSLGLLAAAALTLAAAGLYGIVAYAVAPADEGDRRSLGAGGHGRSGDRALRAERNGPRRRRKRRRAGRGLPHRRGAAALERRRPAARTLGGRRRDLVLGAAGLMATVVPARRDARVDPLLALRTE